MTHSICLSKNFLLPTYRYAVRADERAAAGSGFGDRGCLAGSRMSLRYFFQPMLPGAFMAMAPGLSTAVRVDPVEHQVR